MGQKEAEPPKRMRSSDFSSNGQGNNSANRQGRSKSMLPQPMSSGKRSGSVSRTQLPVLKNVKGGTKRSSSSTGGPMVEKNRNTTPSQRGGTRSSSAEKAKQNFVTPQRIQPGRSSVVQSDRRLTGTGRLSGRGSQVGAKVVKDTRPLSDKQFQQSQVRKILDFLRSEGYPNSSLTSKSFPLTTKEFVAVFNFIYSYIDPKTESVLPSVRFEEDIMRLLKDLDYPGNLSRSNFLTMGSLHSYPTVLGSLSYVCDLAVLFKKVLCPNVVALGFPNRDEMGFTLDRETKEKIHLEHHLNCNIEFNQGADTFPDQLEVLRENLMENQGVDMERLRNVQHQKDLLEKELELYEGRENRKDFLSDKKLKVQSDILKMTDYLEKLGRLNQDKVLEVESKKRAVYEEEDKLKGIEEKVGELRLNCEQKTVSSLEAEKNKLLINEKERQVENAKQDMEEVEKEVWQKEIQASRCSEGLDNFAKQVNSVALQEGLVTSQGEKICLPMTSFHGQELQSRVVFGSEMRLELGDMLRSVRTTTRNTEKVVESSDLSIEQTGDMLIGKKREVEDKDIEQKRLQVELDGFKNKMQNAEAKLDHELSDMREDLRRMKLTERVDVESRERELKSAQDSLDMARIETERERTDGVKFLKKVADRSVTYIEENTGYRDHAVQSVKNQAIKKLQKLKDLAVKIEKDSDEALRESERVIHDN